MKEVTEWNGKPRWMWVWDNDEEHKVKRYVVCILTEEEMKECDTSYPVRTEINYYTHCTEIEEKRPCTREELIEMLKKQGIPMLKFTDGTYYTISRINDLKVITCDDIFYPFKYETLCEKFTLLDGSELWVKE